MAEDLIGFDTNTGLAEGAFANLSPFLGSTLPVVGTSGSNGVAVGATAMTVDVSAGTSYVPGVRHNITTVTNLAISAVTLTGASRWDAVIKRFDWSTNTVTIMVVAGTPSVGAVETAPTLNATPGGVYDQILALVKATNGSTALVVSSRRIWAQKNLTVLTPAALPAASVALYGAICYVVSTDTTYRCLSVSGSPGWVANTSAKQYLTGTDVISTATNWTLTQATGSTVLLPCRGMYDSVGGDVQVDFQIRRSANAITPYSDPGGIPVTTVGTLPSVLCPDADVIPMPFNGQYTTSGATENSWRDASFTVDAVGVVRLHQISAEALAVASSGVSIRAHLTFTKRT